MLYNVKAHHMVSLYYFKKLVWFSCRIMYIILMHDVNIKLWLCLLRPLRK